MRGVRGLPEKKPRRACKSHFSFLSSRHREGPGPHPPTLPPSRAAGGMLGGRETKPGTAGLCAAAAGHGKALPGPAAPLPPPARGPARLNKMLNNRPAFLLRLVFNSEGAAPAVRGPGRRGCAARGGRRDRPFAAPRSRGGAKPRRATGAEGPGPVLAVPAPPAKARLCGDTSLLPPHPAATCHRRGGGGLGENPPFFWLLFFLPLGGAASLPLRATPRLSALARGCSG